MTVAVVGTGVQASHPDLAGRVVTGADFGDGSSGDGTHDSGIDDGQGTHVAGIIAATAHDYQGDGLYGLAPEAQILPIGVFRNSTPDVAATAQAVHYAADHGAKVIDVSVAFPAADPGLKSAVDYATGKGSVIVTGAGDTGATNNAASYPAAFPNVVSVAATDQQGHVWPGSYHGTTVALAAPGVGILTAARDGTYWMGDGTQYAAPWVAASFALLSAAHPGWTPTQLVHELSGSADHPGSPSASGRSGSASGRDQYYGAGVVNPVKALSDKSTPAAQQNPSATGSQTGNAGPGHASSDTPAIVAGTAAVAVLAVLATIAAVLLRRRRLQG